MWVFGLESNLDQSKYQGFDQCIFVRSFKMPCLATVVGPRGLQLRTITSSRSRDWWFCWVKSPFTQTKRVEAFTKGCQHVAIVIPRVFFWISFAATLLFQTWMLNHRVNFPLGCREIQPAPSQEIFGQTELMPFWVLRAPMGSLMRTMWKTKKLKQQVDQCQWISTNPYLNRKPSKAHKLTFQSLPHNLLKNPKMSTARTPFSQQK